MRWKMLSEQSRKPGCLDQDGGAEAPAIGFGGGAGLPGASEEMVGLLLHLLPGVSIL